MSVEKYVNILKFHPQNEKESVGACEIRYSKRVCTTRGQVSSLVGVERAQYKGNKNHISSTITQAPRDDDDKWLQYTYIYYIQIMQTIYYVYNIYFCCEVFFTESFWFSYTLYLGVYYITRIISTRNINVKLHIMFSH